MDAAIPLGIVINELVTNSLKYTFLDRDKGEIRINLRREDKEKCIKSITEDCKSTNFTLTVSDNGVGIPENLDVEDLDSLGLQLVTSLVDQLDGKFELKRKNGTEFTLRFSAIDKEPIPKVILC
jgi:two-component sensor histidine kinase